MTEMTTTLRELLDAAYEAASIDCHITDKVKLLKAITAFEVSEAIPCNHCHTIECERLSSEDGDPLCVFEFKEPE